MVRLEIHYVKVLEVLQASRKEKSRVNAVMVKCSGCQLVDSSDGVAYSRGKKILKMPIIESSIYQI